MFCPHFLFLLHINSYVLNKYVFSWNIIPKHKLNHKCTTQGIDIILFWLIILKTKRIICYQKKCFTVFFDKQIYYECKIYVATAMKMWILSNNNVIFIMRFQMSKQCALLKHEYSNFGTICLMCPGTHGRLLICFHYFQINRNMPLKKEPDGPRKNIYKLTKILQWLYL